MMQFLLKWLFRVPSNLWRCKVCKKRGCCPIDYPDGDTFWHCWRCGAEYWEPTRKLPPTELELDSILMRKPNGGLE